MYAALESMAGLNIGPALLSRYKATDSDLDMLAAIGSIKQEIREAFKPNG